MRSKVGWLIFASIPRIGCSVEGKHGVCLCLRVLLGPSGLVNCCLHANLKKKKKLWLSHPDRHSAFIIYVFKRKKNVVDINDSGKIKTKLIKASDSPRCYREFSGEAEVRFHCCFDIPGFLITFWRVSHLAKTARRWGRGASLHMLFCNVCETLTFWLLTRQKNQCIARLWFQELRAVSAVSLFCQFSFPHLA